MPRFVLPVALLAALAACHRTPAPTPLTADPESGRTLVGGTVVGGVDAYGAHVWRAIPYARPPVGAQRWRAPQPPAAWTGTRDALAPAPPCPQIPSVFGGVEATHGEKTVGQEDCLYLNVYAPRFAPAAVPAGGERLPVMVWIHGGGNVVGHGGRYEGGNLAVTEHVIVVTLNYRLGPFGWFRHAALRDESGLSDDDRSGNFGTLDLVRALAWLRENVTAFGGDPERVTIFGESAGARDVFTLVLSPRARDLFQRAIVQSGGTATTPVEEAERFADDTPPAHPNSSSEILLRLDRAAHPGRSRADAKAALAAMPSAAIAAWLRGLSPAELLLAYPREEQEGLIDVPQLFRDGTVLPSDDSLTAIRSGSYNRVPTIFGTNRDENKLFQALDPAFTWRLLGLVPVVRDHRLYDATARHVSRQWKARGADEPATLLHAFPQSPAFVYRFDWDEEPAALHLVDVGRLIGAAHGMEIPFVFGHWDLGSQTNLIFAASNEAGRVPLSRQMMGYWAEFARRGDPRNGGGAGAPWEPFGADGRFLVLDTGAGGGVRMERGTLTTDQVLAEVAQDPDLASAEEKCGVYRRLMRWGTPTAAQYPVLVSGACARFPVSASTTD
jgi:para-nitrobenzyl esterase